MTFLYALLDWSWLPACAIHLLLPALGLSQRRYYAARMWTDASQLVRSVAVYAHDGSRYVLPVVGFWVAMLWWDHREYRKHRDDDDDDLGKGVRSWARSHLPRPTIVRLRPIEAAGAGR